MEAEDEEDHLLRAVALRTSSSILLARQRAEEELVRAKQALELRTQELAHSLALTRATLEATTDGILATDDARKVTSFNENFVRMWGLPRDVLVSGDHRCVLDLTSRLFADPQEFLSRIDAIYAETADVFDVLQLADGRVFERFSRIQNVEGRNVGRVWCFRDVTERRRAEEADRVARANLERVGRVKDEFLATLSHELRTPLTAILGWVHILQLKKDDADSLATGLEVIARNARAQTKLIDELLDLSRIVSGKVRLDVQPTHLASVVEAAVDSVRPSANSKAIRLRTILDPLAGPVFGDPNRLQQVMWNLLSNAVKFTPKGGAVDVVLERIDSQLETTVTDSGIGISPEFLPQVFDRFRQADASTTRTHGGLGLGLSIVKHLVELHGGNVRAKSEGQGKGATFTVSLPLAPVRSEQHREHPTTQRAPMLGSAEINLAGVKVLVIDDEPDARELIKQVLALSNAEVTTAPSAAEGLLLVEALKPDVVVSDIGMPGKDGYQFIRELRSLPASNGGRTPAIALTAFARSEDRTRAMLAGYQVHISKPIEPPELIATVGSLAARRRSGES